MGIEEASPTGMAGSETYWIVGLVNCGSQALV